MPDGSDGETVDHVGITIAQTFHVQNTHNDAFAVIGRKRVGQTVKVMAAPVVSG
jgi:hypothetical protein